MIRPCDICFWLIRMAKIWNATNCLLACEVVYWLSCMDFSPKSVATTQHTSDSVTLCCHQTSEAGPGLLELPNICKSSANFLKMLKRLKWWEINLAHLFSNFKLESCLIVLRGAPFHSFKQERDVPQHTTVWIWAATSYHKATVKCVKWSSSPQAAVSRLVEQLLHWITTLP